jgi:hypothetical protein
LYIVSGNLNYQLNKDASINKLSHIMKIWLKNCRPLSVFKKADQKINGSNHVYKRLFDPF